MHPGREQLGFDFVELVKAAKNKSIFRKVPLPAADRRFFPVGSAVNHLVAMRHADDLFTVERAMIRWRDNRISDDVVDESGSAGGQESQVGDLDRRGFQGQDLHAVVVCVTH